MRSILLHASALITICTALTSCSNENGPRSVVVGPENARRVPCSTPGAIRENPYSSTSNPTIGPEPGQPGGSPCYIVSSPNAAQ